ncbi:putative PEP-CTERM system TPR-repeat lipoprotein [Duganella sp. 1224]|uniref:XrtA/PEP-CTERM system TPR-repeat protein PrsT n=1 Tax=Duganella sp. 1224 TaxID=2587052 RepID=UPI0015CA681A|nr:XrtA/PEP-CTERM system TPR-repeat protein PrsT [Duganella sp. 1224]NYE60093.1 putative PEP-CTERM system TPR-repeat lipoprotein [Duganella sp. 1224]
MGLLRVWWVVLMLAACSRMHSESDLLAEAGKHMARGEARAAVIQLKNALQQTPSDGKARLMLGQLYLDTGDVQSADKELRRALELGINPGEVRPLLGKALLQQGLYQQVLDEIPADQQQPQLQALRGHALLGLNRLDEGRAAFEQIMLRHPDSAPALLGQARLALLDGNPDGARALVKKVLAQQPDNIEALRLHGDILRLLNKNDEALAAYQRILQLRPVQLQPHVDMANLYIQSGKLAEARKELSIARQAAPNSLMLIYTLSLLEFRENKMTAAQDHLAMVLRAAPDHLPSNLLMGAVLRSKGAYTQAEQHLRKFLESNPGNPYASKLLASTLMNSGSPEQALAVVAPLFDSQQQDLEMMTLAGELYMRLRQYARSAEYFERASKLAPQTPLLHAALAMSHMGMGDTDRAVAELEHAAGLDGKSSRVATLLVLSQIRNKQYDKALDTVKRLEAQAPQNPMVQNLKGGVLLIKSDPAAARASFERALAIDPLFLPALDNLTSMDLKDKKPEAARKRMEASLAKDQDNTAIMLALADLALKQGQLKQTQTWLERAVQAKPEALEPSMRLAHFYSRNNEVQKALTLAQKLQATNPGNAQVVALVAALQSRIGQDEAALDNWNKLAVLQPNSPLVQHQLAGARAEVHDKEGAAQALSKALALYQQDYDKRPSSTALLALYGALVQAGRTDEARSRVQQWLASHGSDVTTRVYFASSLLAQKDYPAAIAQFEQVVKQVPTEVIALNNLAWLYQQQRDPRALEYAEKAHQLAPNSAIVTDTLAWVLVEQGKLARALPLLKQALAQVPDNAEIRYHYGVALAKSGDKRGARQQLEPLLATKGYDRRDAVLALLAQ